MSIFRRTDTSTEVPRWFLDGTRVAQLACDNQIGSSTAYRYLHEVIDVLAAVAPVCTAPFSLRASPGTPTSTWMEP
jgi:hypothetical protein